MTSAEVNDCFANNDLRLSHVQALSLLRERTSPVAGTETVGLDDALGRCLAQAVVAGGPVPAHTNSAVDGYAFAAADYDPAAGSSMLVRGRAAAGHPETRPAGATHAIRIFTGAVMPGRTDTVAMQEDCRIDGEAIFLPPGLKIGANVRKAGEDVAAGTVVFAPGHILRPQDLAALASIGADRIACFERLRVALVASGDEVMAAGSGSLRDGHVYDANTPMLVGLVRQAGCNAAPLGIWRDDLPDTTARLAAACRDFDIVITTGGASRGEEDHMGAALAALGTRHFWQIAVKPGRPMMFGQVARPAGSGLPPCVVIGLPGNPVAVFVCFLMYVLPLLRHLGGTPWSEPRRYKLPATFDFRNRKPGRREFWRGMLVETPAGLGVEKFARDGSGLISGLRAADGLIDIAEDAGDVAAGDLVDFIPFTEFGIGR